MMYVVPLPYSAIEEGVGVAVHLVAVPHVHDEVTARREAREEAARRVHEPEHLDVRGEVSYARDLHGLTCSHVEPELRVGARRDTVGNGDLFQGLYRCGGRSSLLRLVPERHLLEAAEGRDGATLGTCGELDILHVEQHLLVDEARLEAREGGAEALVDAASEAEVTSDLAADVEPGRVGEDALVQVGRADHAVDERARRQRDAADACTAAWCVAGAGRPAPRCARSLRRLPE